ncbi:outer membrane protein TolC [Bisbaumannia pacifica]|uniref:Outer membrane protein TolC n=1 Tax=Bisbaumannia pacifica TaxID=77098 RepID=A0A510XCA7_9GAMM|nr:TolC family protein [Halomonas pacifica]GEK48337.1 outer membrane protein TolC [Halomonas pacifica]
MRLLRYRESLAMAMLAASLSGPVLAQALEEAPAGAEAMADLRALQDEVVAVEASSLPSLTELFRQALRHDSQLSRKRYELEATEQEGPMARSRLLPQLSANANYLWQDSTNLQTSPDDFGLDKEATRPGEITEHYWQVQLQQPLFSLERWRGLARAEAEIGMAEWELALTEEQLALQVSEAYINAFLASRRLGLLESQQDALELQLRQANRAYELGVGDRISLLESQSRLDQAIADAVQAENELDNALSELERLTGSRPAFENRRVGDLAAVAIRREWGDEQDWLERINDNLNVRRALAEREVAQSNTRVRRSGYFPELNLNLSYSDRVSEDELRESEDYRASVELSMPLYQGGYTRASVRQGELLAQAANEGVDHERNLAAQEVRQRLRSLNGSVRRLEALEQAIESSELFLAAAERGEQLGLRDLVDVLDARASLYDQRIQFVDTLGRYALDHVALSAAVGELDSGVLNRIMVLLISIHPVQDA